MNGFVVESSFMWLNENGEMTNRANAAELFPTHEAASEARAAMLKKGLINYHTKAIIKEARLVPYDLHRRRLDSVCAGREYGWSRTLSAAYLHGPRQPGDEGTPVVRAPRGSGGVTTRVREWVLSHPQATKADALAAFPEVNPSTVGVQFGAAKKQLREQNEAH